MIVGCLSIYPILGGMVSLAQDDQPRDGRYYETQARKAYQEKDYSAFLAHMKRAVELRPNHPGANKTLAREAGGRVA